MNRRYETVLVGGSIDYIFSQGGSRGGTPHNNARIPSAEGRDSISNVVHVCI